MCVLKIRHQERHEAATHNVLVTDRTARFLRPADRAERIFRSAVISLTKRHAFARQLVNTGHMADCIGNTRWATVRPDSYIAATGAQLDTSLTRALNAATGATV